MHLLGNLSVVGLCMLASAGLGTLSATAQDDIDAMMGEIERLVVESEDVDKELKIALEQENTSERDAIAVEAARKERGALDPQIDAAWAELASSYETTADKTVDCGDDATCSSRIDAHNALVIRSNALLDQIEAAGAARSAASGRVQMLRERRQQITRRVAFLRSQVAVRRAAANAQSFADRAQECKTLASRDAASQCLMHIWDGARSVAETPAMGNVVKPEFSATVRTAEEAIAEYKGSGQLRQLPKEFRTRALEPPSPNLGSPQ